MAICLSTSASDLRTRSGYVSCQPALARALVPALPLRRASPSPASLSVLTSVLVADGLFDPTANGTRAAQPPNPSVADPSAGLQIRRLLLLQQQRGSPRLDGSTGPSRGVARRRAVRALRQSGRSGLGCAADRRRAAGVCL